MRLLADVHVRSAYVTALRGDGHDVDRVVDVLDESASDTAIVDYARETERAVVTNDAKDFTEMQGGSPRLQSWEESDNP